MPKMKLLKTNWRYAKQPLVAGDVFDVKDIHVPLLTKAKIAEPVDAKAKALAKGKKTRAAPKAKAAARKGSARAKKPVPASGRYGRRDMRAK